MTFPYQELTVGDLVRPDLRESEQILVEKIVDSTFLKQILSGQPIKQRDLNKLYDSNFLSEIALSNNDNGLLLDSFNIILDTKHLIKFYVVLFGTSVCLLRESEIKLVILEQKII